MGWLLLPAASRRIQGGKKGWGEGGGGGGGYIEGPQGDGHRGLTVGEGS